MFGQLFRQADTENIGVVTGEVAVKFFEKTRLEPRILGEVSLLGRPFEARRFESGLLWGAPADGLEYRFGRLQTRKTAVFLLQLALASFYD